MKFDVLKLVCIPYILLYIHHVFIQTLLLETTAHTYVPTHITGIWQPMSPAIPLLGIRRRILPSHLPTHLLNRQSLHISLHPTLNTIPLTIPQRQA